MIGYKTVRGSLYNEDGTWVVRARVFDPVSGKTRNKSKSTGYKVKDNTKRKAEKAMKEIVEEWEKLANSEVIADDPLMSEYVHKWLKQQELSLRENTILSYRGYANKYILPELGNYKIREITLSQLNNFYKKLLKDVSVNSVKKYHVVVCGALYCAVQDGVIPYNVGNEVKFPRAKKYEGKAYSASQVASLLEAAAKEGEPIHAAIMLGVCYGLRRGEICGLSLMV